MGGVASAAVDEQPPGLVATNVTLERVRAIYDRGHRALPHARSTPIVEEWRLAQDGMMGTVRTERLAHESRTITTLGPFVTESGTHGTYRWQQTRNGITVISSLTHDRDAISEHAFLTAKGDRADVHVAGEAPALDDYVVEVNPPGGRHEWLYIDRRTGILDREDRVERHRRYVVTYNDFQRFDGGLLPTRMRSIDSFGNERDEMLVSRSYDPVYKSHTFDIPPNRRTFVDFGGMNGPVRLPARLVNGLFVVRVLVDGHSADFLLDSGSAAIAIDSTLADTLGIEHYGATTNATIGTYAETSAIVPQMAIGSLRLTRVAVRVIPIGLHADLHTRVSGLLGFDFFAATTLHVDYERGTVDAYAPGAYRAPDGMTPVAIALDDKTPAVRARVGASLARMRVDTGSNRTLLFTGFADRSDVGAVRLPETGSFAGVGGTGRGEMLRLRSLDFANIALPDQIVESSPDDFSFEDADGLLGADVLRNFDLWFDYRGGTLHARRARTTAHLLSSR